MKTPISDFVKNYAEKEAIRLHMPGHKGVSVLGCEAFDITEIDGADVLYHPHGILAQSQNIARDLFGAKKTLYSWARLTWQNSPLATPLTTLSMALFTILGT